MITMNTTLYTHGTSTQDVIDGFLGNMSAGQVVDGSNEREMASELVTHCTEVDPQNYATSPDDLQESGSGNVVSFTCADIAVHLVKMAEQELQYA